MKSKINIYFISVLLAASLWGTAGIFVRSAENTALSQMQLVFWRALITALILGVIIVIKDIELFKIKLKDIWLFISAGLFSIILFNFSYYTTMSLTSLSVAAVLLYTAPFFVVMISLFLFAERLTANKAVACITAFIGCGLVSGIFDSTHRISGKALFFGLLTGFGYALYTVFSELLIKKGYATLTITFYVFLTAAMGCLPLLNVGQTVSYTLSTPKALITVFLMAVFNTVIPYILYTSGLRGVAPSAAPIIATVEPVVATVIGAVIFAEGITFSGILGIILVLASVVILNLKPTVAYAHAKINLTLAITGKRDDGYHLIDTVMQTVSLADTVKVKKCKEITVVCSKSALSGVGNIAYAAAKLFFEYTKINSGAYIYIKKRIPEAAGLGGGSADAAAVLLALNKLYKTELSSAELEEMALRLGADVPFFIKGGIQRAEGIGEILTTLAPLKKGWFIIAKADNKPSTAQMYKQLDGENYPIPDNEAFIEAIKENDTEAMAKAFGNSFTAVWPDNPLKEILLKLEPDGLSLSGSGPTWFAFYNDKKRAIEAYRQLKAQNINCYLTKPCDVGISFE